MVDSLRLDYQALLDGKVPEEDTENWDTLLILHIEVCKMKDVEDGSRSGKLWLNFTKFMAIVRMFIRAERTGNWGLHLEATYNMLPFLAAGHNNYTKSCRLYLQGCQRSLCQCLQQQFNNGLFTIYNQCQGAVSIRKTVLPGMAIPMLKIRRPNGRLIFNMEIAIRR